MEVTAINDIADPKALAYLLKFDTVMGKLEEDVKLEGDILRVGRQETKMLNVKEPSKLPWGALGVDVVIESTGRFLKRSELEGHIQGGAPKVILTVPAKDKLDATVVMGVNDNVLKPGMKIVSNASCTTNCLAPVAKVLHEKFGIVRGLMTTVHAYTNDQRLAEVAALGPPPLARRGREHHPDDDGRRDRRRRGAPRAEGQARRDRHARPRARRLARSTS